MTLAELLGVQVPYRLALAGGILVALSTVLLATPRTIRKLEGAGITGPDRHKADTREVAEMGGLAVFLAFNVGAFTIVGLGNLPGQQQRLILAALVVAAGACITGVLDDLLQLRQRFKALIPFAFSAPLALFVTDTMIAFPIMGRVEMGLVYPILLVPIAIACASNGFNLLEGFNGLGAGLGLVTASTMSLLAILQGSLAGLALLFPLVGALGGFLYFNAYPADVFPGDTMTLMVGAVLASGAILSKIEFWGALLFLPQIVDFFVKGFHGFPNQKWGGTLTEDGRLVSEQEDPVGLAQVVLEAFGGLREPQVFGVFVVGQILLSVLVVAGFLWL